MGEAPEASSSFSEDDSSIPRLLSWARCPEEKKEKDAPSLHLNKGKIAAKLIKEGEKARPIKERASAALFPRIFDPDNKLRRSTAYQGRNQERNRKPCKVRIVAFKRFLFSV